MKFFISKDVLLSELQPLISVVGRRQNLPILANVLLESFPDSGFQMTVSDMEVELVSSSDVKLDTHGGITIPARKLLDICRSLPEASNLEFDVSDGKVKIRSGKSRFILSSQPAEDFPVTNVDDFHVDFSIKQSDFKSLLGDTSFAMAQQDVRYYLNGLLLEIKTGSLRAVATDGHRLALKDISAKTVVMDKDLYQVILPRKAIIELDRLFDTADQDLRIQISVNHIRFQIGHLRFTSKLIDGKFPDYRKVIPESQGNQLVADRDLLRESLARASILSNEKYRGIRIKIASGSLRAQAQNSDQEEAEDEISIEYEGEPIEIGFNVTYLLDAIRVIKTDKVRIIFKDADNSCLIISEKEESCRYVVMPMRL